MLIVGHRKPGGVGLFYPASEPARRFGAEAPQATADPKAAYSDVARRKPVEAPRWPL